MTLFRKLAWLKRRREKEAELQAELQFHLEEESEGREASGASGAEARWAARRELGNLGLIQENTRAAWGWTWIEQLFQDLRYAWRTMLQNPAFTALAALSLALGIGANTAIYSFMDALLLRSLPVGDAESLVVLQWHGQGKSARDSVVHSGSGEMWADGKTGRTAGIFPFPAFELMRKTENVFSSIFAYYPTRNLNLVIKGQAEVADGEYVSGDYFRGLEVPPAAGRLITDDDDRPGSAAVVVLGYGFAEKRFGDIATAPGQSILINNLPFTVIGVAAPGFFGVDPAAAPDYYLPLRANLLFAPDFAKSYLDRNYYWLEMMGRLKPGVSIRQAQAALGPQFHTWVEATAHNDQERTTLPELMLKPGAGGLDKLRRTYSQPLYVLLAMVGLILAIACANIANLLLARATARRREMAVRLSMGAGRLRVIRQLLTESLLLASLGGVMGVLFAIWGVRALILLLANSREHFTIAPDVNWHVLAAAIALSMITGLLFGLAPALAATRVDVMPALKQIRGTGRSPSRIGLSQALVAAQIALSLLMLVAAGLFVRTLSNLHAIELGFRSEKLLVFHLNAEQAGHHDPEMVSFYRDLQKRFSSVPGVRGVALSNWPLGGEGSWYTPVTPVGSQPQGQETTHILVVAPGFFDAMGIDLVAGRAIDERDKAGSPAVAMINEAYAKQYFGNRNPIGQHVLLESVRKHPPREMEIVGVTKNVRYGDLKSDFPPVVYMPLDQRLYVTVDEAIFALRTSGDPTAYVNTVREIVRQADARVPVTGIRTQAAMIDRTMNQEIIFARLCTGFSLLALAIACVGLYGTMSYTVARRTGEIGIRMALGARSGRVMGMILSHLAAMTAAGLAIGVPAAFVSSRLVASFLYGIKPTDPLSIGAAVAALVIAALVAGYAPARRAARIDPLVALRHE